MSEQILKALMQLFGIIAKQDDGVNEAKISYVENFLKLRIAESDVNEYLELFNKHAQEKKRRRKKKEGEAETEVKEENKASLTSMTDSVRTLGICKKINRTLTQKQKIVVIVRLLELVNSDRNFSEQRLAIIDTASQVFKITQDEYKSIELFVKGNQISDFDNENVLVVTDEAENLGEESKFLRSENLNKLLLILRIPSVNLYFLRYNGSHDIVFNGLSIDNTRVYLLPEGATIKPPMSKTIYYSDISSIFLASSTSVKLSFNANNLVYEFSNGNIGLRDISLSEESGKLIGIMGASGAGKTTLLNVLAGLETPTSGEVLINGIDLHRETELLEGVIGYVPQDDLLIEELTVYENLFYNAKLCFKDYSDREISEQVLSTLDSLGLSKARDLKVGNPLEKTISGGQRKRLNIALELIREPSVLFLDEPTSGLSSKDSENILDLLRLIALKGKLVYVVIHQPSSEIYKSFDKIVFLDVGGYLIYNGNPVEAVSYFKTIDHQINSNQGSCPTCGNVNSEIIFNIIEAKTVDEYGNSTSKRKVEPEGWSRYYKEKITEVKVIDEEEAPKKSLFIPNKINQFKVFLTRDFKSKISNKQYILINLLQTPILAFFLSYLIRYIADEESDVYIFRENENIPAYILMCIVVSLFVGLTVSAEEIFKDRKILKRESFLNLSKFSYLLSKIFILFTLSAVQVAFLVVIGNFILGIEGLYFDYWLMLFSISCFANVLGLNISNTFNSAVTIYIIIPLLIIPQMVLAGAMFSFDKLNRNVGGGHEVPAVAQMMPSRWAYEGLVVNQYLENKYEKQWYNYEKRESEYHYKTAFYIPELKKALNNVKSDTDTENNLMILKNEFEKESKISRTIKSPVVSEDMSEESYDEILAYIDELNDLYTKRYNTVANQKEQKIGYMMQINENRFRDSKNRYENEYLTDLVKNAFTYNKILHYENELIQIIDPIYQEPKTPELFNFSQPFYSPYKFILNQKISTFNFNLIVIWLSTIFVFLALYFDWLSKLLNFAEKKKVLPKKIESIIK